MLPRGDTGPAPPNTAAGEGVSQVPHLPAAVKGQGKEGIFPSPTLHGRQERYDLLSHVHTLTAGLSMPLAIESALLCYPGKVCVEPSLMSASASEGQGQFFLVLQPVRARPNSVQPYPLNLRWYQEPWMSM